MTADPPDQTSAATSYVHESTETGTGAELTICVDGQVTNLPALRDALGLSFDADLQQVLTAGWRKWSDGLFGRLDGVVAAAVRSEGSLFLYRDPSGLVGLFYGPTNDGIWVHASDLSALRATRGVPCRVDRQALHEYLRLLDIAGPNTICSGVRAVEPGKQVRLTGATCTAHEALLPEARPIYPDTFDGAVAELDAVLGRAVALGLVGSGKRMAAFLSGGVDSALLCALASRQLPGITAVTVSFDGDRFDEAPVAARIAAHLGMEHKVLRFGRADYLRAFDRLSRGMDQPMADPATMATLLACDYCREHFDVVLDGSGAEAVGVMPPRHVRLAVGVGSLMSAGLRRQLVRVMTLAPVVRGYTPILNFEHPAEMLMRWQGFTRAEIEELCGEPVSFEHTTFYRTFARFARGAHYARYSALYDIMPSDRLTQAMRLTGMGVRFPYCARDVDGFLRQLPTYWRHLPAQPKRILRELLARYVPREIWDGPKHGFDFTLHDFLAGDDHELVRRHVLHGRWLHRGLLDPQVVQRHVRHFIGGDRRLLFRVWSLVVLGAWLDAHDDLTIPLPGA